jgi:hypothetical protein
MKLPARYFIHQKLHIFDYFLFLTTIFTMASFSRKSPVNYDMEFDTKNVENRTAIVTGGKCSSKFSGCTSKAGLCLLE